MAAGDRTQIGKAYKVEYGNFTFAGFQPTSVTNSKAAEVETIRDTRNAAICHLITNPGETLNLTCYIEASASITPPIVGTYVSVTPPHKTHPEKFIVATSPSVTHGNSVTVLGLSLIQEDSMETTYNTSATVSPGTTNWDISDNQDLAFTITWNDATAVTSIMRGITTLTVTTHYTVVGTTLTIKAAYLAGVLPTAGSTATLVVAFNVANSATLVITAIA
jgi:hypothetical protein